MRFLIAAIAFLFMFLGSLKAQECEDYHFRKCGIKNKNYKLSAQSRSGMFKKGLSSSFSFKAMEGYEYFIQLCADDNLNDISLIVSNENNNEIFTIDRGDNFVNLVAQSSMELSVKVEVPLHDTNIENVPYDDLYGCVGIRIEYKRFKE